MDGLNTLLYKSDDFGSIKNTARGLAVTEKVPLTTISIALMLADETMGHKPLIINGSPDFHKKVMEATLTANSFQDKMMQREFLRKKERIENARKKFTASGGRIISKRPNIKPYFADLCKDNRRCNQNRILLANGVDELAKEYYQHVR